MEDITASIDSRVYSYQGINFISGLYWRTLSSQATIAKEKPKTIERTTISKPGKETLHEVKAVSADLVGFNQIDETVPLQLGLAQTENANGWINSPVYSFPSLIFKALSNYLNETITNGIVVIAIDEDLYAMAAINNGRIIPRIGDIFDDKNAIEKQASQLLSSGGFRLFCDNHTNISGSETLPELEILIESITPAELKELLVTFAYPRYKKILWTSAIVGTLILSGFVGNSQFSDYLEKEREAREQQISAESLAKQQKEIKPVSVTLHPPLSSLLKCISAYETTKLYPGGWKFAQGDCRFNGYESTFVRGESKIQYLLETYPNANISSDGDEAKTIQPLVFEKISVLDKDLPSKYDVTNALNSYAHSINKKIIIKPKTRPKSLPGREVKHESNSSAIEWQIDIPFYSSFQAFPTQGASLDAVLILPNQEKGLSITVKGTSYVKD